MRYVITLADQLPPALKPVKRAPSASHECRMNVNCHGNGRKGNVCAQFPTAKPQPAPQPRVWRSLDAHLRKHATHSGGNWGSGRLEPSDFLADSGSFKVRRS